MLLAAAASIGWELSISRWKRASRASSLLAARSNRQAVIFGLQRTLPTFLVVTFVLVPSTSTLIFKTFRCDRIEYSASITYKYLHEDLSVSCFSDDYGNTRRVALVGCLVWPVGVPLMYAVLLWASRDALFTSTPTPLSRAIAFLSDDCKSYRSD